MLRCRRAIGLVDNNICCLETRRDIAFTNLDVLQEIAVGPLLMYVRRVGPQCGDRVCYDGQFLVLDIDQVKGCCSDIFTVGCNNRDRVTRVTYLASAQDRPVDTDDTVRIAAWYVLVRQDSMHAIELACGCYVNGEDACVWDVGALGASEQHAGKTVVVREARRAADLRQRIRIRPWFTNFRFGCPCFGQVGRYVLPGRLQDRVNNALVSGAAAVGVLECCADIGFGHCFVCGGFPVQQALGGHDKTGCADAALYRTMIEKCLLQWVQSAVLLNAFDGFNATALCLECRVDAADYWRAVDEDGADAALGLGTADLGTRELQVLAQHVGQVSRFIDLDVDRGAVDCHLQAAHGFVLARRAAVARMIGR